MGEKNQDGYGKLGWRRGHRVRAHRCAWEVAFGPVPPGSLVCHRCDNPSCVNPAHLFLGDHADNAADKVAKGRHPRGPGSHPNGNPVRGERVNTAVLTEELVRYIRARYRRGVWGRGYETIARELGLPLTIVRDVVTHDTWRHVQ
jgi:hypothetical protein